MWFPLIASAVVIITGIVLFTVWIVNDGRKEEDERQD